MAKRKTPKPDCGSEKSESCCTMESIITVDERGQMVLPKDVREKAGIKPGDKFALVCWEKGGSVCCMMLMRIEEFSKIASTLIKPLMQDMTG